MLLESAADFTELHKYSMFISIGLNLVAYLIFSLDIGCPVFFLSIQAYKFEIKDVEL